MKTRAIFLAAALVTGASAASAADVGVSVSIGQPGFYGRIDIGDFPAPAVIYPQPVLVVPPPRGVMIEPPLYLRVPPGHARHWQKHCAEYDACGRRTFFVRDDWYNRVYVPQYRERHDGRQDERREHDRDDWRDDRGRGDDHGHGRGRGHGHD